MTLACVAAADFDSDLRDHVYAALNSGDITITDARSGAAFAVYAGWPKASRFNGVVDDQWERICRDRGQAAPAPEAAAAAAHPSEPGGPDGRRRGVLQGLSTVCRSPPTRDNPYSGAGILNFVFGEMWLRPGLGLKERRLVTVACVAFRTPYPIPATSTPP